MPSQCAPSGAARNRVEAQDAHLPRTADEVRTAVVGTREAQAYLDTKADLEESTA